MGPNEFRRIALGWRRLSSASTWASQTSARRGRTAAFSRSFTTVMSPGVCSSRLIGRSGSCARRRIPHIRPRASGGEAVPPRYDLRQSTRDVGLGRPTRCENRVAAALMRSFVVYPAAFTGS